MMSTATTGTLTATEIPVERLDVASRDAMWRVFARYYTGVDRETFEHDLAAKQRVVLLLDSGDRSIQGFSTIQVYEREVRGRKILAVFSGDTIVEEDYWGQKALQTAFFFFMLRLKLKNPLTPLYWFLISKGYKTYLLLSRNFLEYWPRHDKATPRETNDLMDDLAREKFGGVWDRASGLLRMEGRNGQLRHSVAPVNQEALSEADIRFFVERNPGYVHGDELVCVGAVDLACVLNYAKKRFARSFGRKSAVPLRASVGLFPLRAE